MHILSHFFFNNINEKKSNGKLIEFILTPIIPKKVIYYLYLLLIFFIIITILCVFIYKKEKIILFIAKRDFKKILKNYDYLLDKNETIAEDSPIWIMWYQGIETAPILIKACIQSIIINRKKHPVYIIDKSNLNKYIKLPEYIIQKFIERKFDITHFSDIIRMALLSKYGGYWIDSTFLVNTPLVYDNYSFFTLKLSQCYKGTFTKCRWGGNFLAMPKNSFLSIYAYNCFLFYWKKYDILVDYFLIDEIILIAFDNSLKFRELINKLPLITCNIFTLYGKLSQKFNKTVFQCQFHKLNRRKNQIEFINYDKTNYGYLIDEYKLDPNKINNYNEIPKSY